MHDLVVVSDLHLGRGKNNHTGRFHELEAFFYDEADFVRVYSVFCSSCCCFLLILCRNDICITY